MSLPERHPKKYLEITDRGTGFYITARKEDASPLAALFLQYGISCQRQPDTAPGEDELQFFEGTTRSQVEQVLDGYKHTKGS